MNNFIAKVFRLKHINRWSLMRCNEQENVMEHSYQVAVIAHNLACINKYVFGGDANPDKIATQALFHDATEVITSDIPTPVKYYNKNLYDTFKKLDDVAGSILLEEVQDELKDEYQTLMNTTTSDYKQFIKSADIICVYIKCIQEVNMGNSEFIEAKESALEKLHSLPHKEVRYFIKHYINSFDLSIDRLQENKNIEKSNIWE